MRASDCGFKSLELEWILPYEDKKLDGILISRIL